jgi:DNA-binding CsgD family transcriptional regulator
MRIEAVLPAMSGDEWGTSNDVHDELLARATAATHTLRDLIPWAGYMLSAWDAVSGTHRHVTLASEGYSEQVLEHLNSAFVESNPAFPLLHLRVPHALRWSDLAQDWNIQFAETPTAEEFLIPSGFHEGTTMCLRLPDGRYTGSVHVSWASPQDATDAARAVIEGFRPLLALVCDLNRNAQLGVERLGPDAHAVLVSGDGRVLDMPGRSPGSVLGEGSELRGLLSRQGKRLGRRRYLWPDANGLCHRIETVPCRGETHLVTDRTIPWPFGLTVREAQILHLIAGGHSNPQIASDLWISPRTVSTHVEHLLEKLDCVSRAQLAAVAVRAHLLLMDDPTP